MPCKYCQPPCEHPNAEHDITMVCDLCSVASHERALRALASICYDGDGVLYEYPTEVERNKILRDAGWGEPPEETVP